MLIHSEYGPTKLAKLLDADDFTNISHPWASNDRIVRLTLSWITQHYIKPIDCENDLFVVVGLTSPERKDFYYRDPKLIYTSTWLDNNMAQPN